ncbi:hypothetical protein VZT92_013724 [Zoarces viviparus]|uniref:Uncharacterized protein n=1 Tax=Zoarces viviparus TaxID=48416 RepID=A0AAW1F5D8_ZOAVI
MQQLLFRATRRFTASRFTRNSFSSEPEPRSDFAAAFDLPLELRRDELSSIHMIQMGLAKDTVVVQENPVHRLWFQFEYCIVP